MKSIIFILSLMAFSFNAHANFTITKDGKTYECTEKSGSSCWDACPYSFSTCATACGGGQKCWDACPYSFSTCSDECGGGDGCWESCPYSFSTCSDDCGGGQKCWDACPYSFSTCSDECGGSNVSPKVFEKFMNSSKERLEKEKADGVISR